MNKYFYIGFSKNKQGKIGSILISRYMRKEYSHVFVEYDTMKNVKDNTIFHSSMSSGVAYWSNKNFEKSNVKTHLYKVEVTEEMFLKLRQITHIHAGDHYGYWQNLGILIVDFLKNLGISVKNPFRENENYSELVFLFLQELHPELKDKYDQNTIRPDHIQEILENYNYVNVLK